MVENYSYYVMIDDQSKPQVGVSSPRYTAMNRPVAVNLLRLFTSYYYDYYGRAPNCEL